MSRSIKDHPCYLRMKVLPPAEAAAQVLGERTVVGANKEQRKLAFRNVARSIMLGREERTRYGFNSDTNGEIARAMEWAFQAGQKAVQTER